LLDSRTYACVGISLVTSKNVICGQIHLDKLSEFMPSSLENFSSNWRLIISLLVGAITGLIVTSVWNLPYSTGFITGWDVAVILYIVNIIIMIRTDTIYHHFNNAKQSTWSILSLIIFSSLICIYAISKQAQMSKNYHDLTLILSIGLTVFTIFTTWLMIQILFAMQYAYQYFTQAQLGGELPLAFPEIANELNEKGAKFTPQFEDFFYCSVSIGTSGQTADTCFASTAGRKLATIHCIIAFIFNLVVIALLINILATYL